MSREQKLLKAIDMLFEKNNELKESFNEETEIFANIEPKDTNQYISSF